MLFSRTVSSLIAGVLMVPFCCCAFGALSLEDPVAEHSSCCSMPDPRSGNETPDSGSHCGESCASKNLTELAPQDRPDSSILLTSAVPYSFLVALRASGNEKLTFRQDYWKPPPAELRKLHCSWLI